jgi:tetratricopeptide (TPR) repeat protein
MVWPSNLAVFYPPPETISWWQVAVAILFLVIVSLLVIRTLKTRPYLAVGWLWYLVTLVPSIGLIQAGLWPAMADRFAYVPLIGLFVMVAWGVPELLAKYRYQRIVLAASTTILLATFTVVTMLQVRHWQNSFTLFQQTVKVTANNLGVALFNLGQLDQAISHYRTAIKLDPNFGKAHNNLGNALARKGMLDEAISQYSRALELKTDYPEAHNNLGVALAQQGKMNEAIVQFDQALRLKPDYAQARANLGYALDLVKERRDESSLSSTP